MGFLRRLWGKRSEPEKSGDRPPDLAFILLSYARLPDPDELVEHFRSLAAPGESLQIEASDGKNEEGREVLCLRLSTGESCFVALMPAPVPNGEAEGAVRFSVSSFRAGQKLQPHQAHLMVVLMAVPGTAPLVCLSRFTSVLAAVSAASCSVGIYWGNAGATHDAEFFASLAGEQGVAPRMMLWTGVSVARESDGRLSLLSLGMAQLALPNLLLVAGPESEGEALETMFDLLAYVARRGEPIREGETVGRTDEQRLPVQYVRSPMDSKVKVWRVELP